jgi:hypothetical protein
MPNDLGDSGSRLKAKNFQVTSVAKCSGISPKSLKRGEHQLDAQQLSKKIVK